MAMTYGYLAIEQIYPSDASSEMQHNPLDVLKNFQLYLGLDQLMSLFDNTLFVLIFWIHSLTISLLLGAWIANDAIKHNLNKFIVLFPLILTYFSGPIGLFLYLFLRLLIVQKFKMYD